MAGCMMISGQRVGAAAPRLIFTVFCLLSSVFCCAEDLLDPTRPPASISAHEEGVGVVHGILAENYSRGLHTIIISDTRRAAIIDGKTVELGEEHSGARLIEVNEHGVVLERGHSRQVLTLFPDVKITRKNHLPKN
jgi:MSHA biogenesis protein MshK